MQIEWLWGLLGGMMIGSAAAVYLLWNGRIMGVSDIAGSLVDRSGWHDWRERGVFLAGNVIAPLVLVATLWPSSTHVTANWLVIIASGLLVGIGTRLANGCTTGHGVCGISRLSLRGIVATLIYLGAGMAMMTLMRHALGVI